MQVILATRISELDITNEINKKSILNNCIKAKNNLATILQNDNVICIPGQSARFERFDIYNIETALYTTEQSSTLPTKTKITLKNNIYGQNLGDSDIIIVSRPYFYSHTDLEPLLINKTIIYIDSNNFGIQYYIKNSPIWNELLNIVKPWKRLKLSKKIEWKK